jgi:RecB family exonuclease
MYSGDECPTLEDILKTYKRKWQRAGYATPEAEAKAKRDGEAMITAFYKKHAKGWTQPFCVEYALDFTVDHVRVIGYIDMVVASKSGAIHVIDWKTGKSLATGRIEEDPQLTMYQLGVEAMGVGRVAKLSLYHVPSLTMQSSKRHSEALVSALKMRIVETAARISAKEFEPTPSERACGFCDFKSFCPSWK